MSQREPIRILHFADIHIGMENYGRLDPETGLNQRVLDFVSRLKEIVDYAIEHEADLVIFAGDAFKTRDPNPTYQRAFARQIMRLSRAKIATILLVGNHDMPIIEQRASSMDIFATLDVPNVIVGREERLHRIETARGIVQVATVPWPQRSRLLKYEEHRGMTIEQLDQELERVLDDELRRLANEVDPSLPAILTGHFTIHGAVFGSERNVMLGRDTVIKLSSLCLEAWDYVAMGHIHKHQDVNPSNYPGVVYSGSLERIDFGEENEPKGFCWIEARRGDTQWRFERMDSVRRFVSIYADATPDGDHPTDAVLRAIERHDVKNAVVRVRDNGYGIPPDKLDIIWEPFVRIKDPRYAHVTGTGLGLSLVKSFTEVHGGYVSVESVVDVGSEFAMHLPFRPVEARPTQSRQLLQLDLSALLAHRLPFSSRADSH
jgi:exonuclease SbcD